MPNCVFCEIVAGRRPARIVYEDGLSLAFLDHRPLFHGHTLVVPRAHHETLGLLPPDAIDPFFRVVQLLARAVENACDADGSFVAINNRVSQSVPHIHVHVVPRRRKDGLRGFFWPRLSYASDAAMVETQRAILAALAA